jgi:hypothetical protein
VWKLAGFFDVENFASLIVPALGAGVVGHLFLVTVGALRKGMAFESVVGAPGRSALLGVSPFWIRHGSKFLLAAIVSAAENLSKLSAISRQLSA